MHRILIGLYARKKKRRCLGRTIKNEKRNFVLAVCDYYFISFIVRVQSHTQREREHLHFHMLNIF